MLAVVVTSCSNRKRRPAVPRLEASNLPSGSSIDVAHEWAARLAVADDRTPAKRLYCGRSFQEAVQAAARAQAPLYVVSAGLGLIAADALIPSYSLTIAPHSADNILTKIGGRLTGEWWREIGRCSPLATSVAAIAARLPQVPILIALPNLYFRMVQNELLSLPGEARSRLRLFSRRVAGELDAAVGRFIMPYDDRLDGHDSIWRGTQADFAARAMRHFVETILAADPDASAEVHAHAVQAALADWTRTPVPRRPRLADDAIRALIGTYWDVAEGRSSRLLRLLRDNLSVACEQGRFRDLFHQVKRERENRA